MSVFKINHEHDTILNPDAAKLCEHLQKVSKKELLYIILAYDHTDGPFRLKGPDERKNLAKKRVYKTMDTEPETPEVVLAIEEYKSLIFDVRKETVDNYKKKILRLQKDSLMEEVSVAKLKEIDTAINFLQTRITEIESEIFTEEKYDAYIKGDKKLSMIEKWQMNIRKYNEHKMI